MKLVVSFFYHFSVVKLKSAFWHSSVEYAFNLCISEVESTFTLQQKEREREKRESFFVCDRLRESNMQPFFPTRQGRLFFVAREKRNKKVKYVCFFALKDDCNSDDLGMCWNSYFWPFFTSRNVGRGEKRINILIQDSTPSSLVSAWHLRRLSFFCKIRLASTKKTNCLIRFWPRNRISNWMP